MLPLIEYNSTAQFTPQLMKELSRNQRVPASVKDLPFQCMSSKAWATSNAQ